MVLCNRYLGIRKKIGDGKFRIIRKELEGDDTGSRDYVRDDYDVCPWLCDQQSDSLRSERGSLSSG
jgi:hypothetical protein